jgi:hypothetical protein
LQLLSCGYFPCAPLAPTLAVDLKILEFVRELFVRMPPNTTSWCETLEAFLGSQGYKLKTRVWFLPLYYNHVSNHELQDTLRRRLRNALQWYYSLINKTTDHIQELLMEVRSLVSPNEDPSVWTLPKDTASGFHGLLP